MKIIQANKYYFMRGGAERYMLDVSAHLSNEGNTVIPFAMKHESNLQSEYSNYFVSPVETQNVAFGYKAIKTFGRLMYSFEARRKMDALLHNTKPDLCHVHNIYTQISPSILDTLQDHNVPVIMTVHDHHLISPQYNIWAEGCGNDYRSIGLVRGTFLKFHKGSHTASFAQVFSYKFHRMLKIYEKNIRLFLCPSEYIKRQLIRGGFDRQKIRVNPYGFDCSRIEPRYDHDGYMLFVGRLSEEKGVETIIKLAKTLPEIPFKIVGRGPSMDHLHRLAIGTKNVEFLGFRDGSELTDLYNGATAVLVPSRVNEIFPLTILEAMSAGKPVLASNVGGILEVLEDHVTGILLQPNDLNSWMEAVLRMYYDTDLQTKLSRNARYVLDTKFRVEDHYKRLSQFYQEIMQ